jgi:hypothetical protein
LAAVLYFGQTQRNRAEALALNQAVVNANRKLADAGKSFGVTLSPLIQHGQNPDVRTVRNAYDRAVKIMQEVHADMRAAKVPDSLSARFLHQAHQRMLKNQETIVRDHFGEIVRVVEDENLSPAEKKRAIEDVFAKIRPLESGDVANVQVAQRKMAEEYNYRLVPPK